MDASPAQLRALLEIVACSLAAAIGAVVWLVRSGRAVQFPDLSGGAEASSRRRRRVSVR